MNQDWIDALLRERAGYVARNLPARVALVDEELRRAGYRVEEKAVRPAPENTAVKRGRPRKGE
jgi:hypothetical protein